MCGLFVCARVREARKRGWEISIFWDFWELWGGVSEGEKFLIFWEI